MNYFLLLWFSFKNFDLFDRQTTQFDFSLSNLFVIFTSCGLKLWAKSSHTNNMLFRVFFHYRFYFWLCIFYVLHYQLFIVISPKLLVIWCVAEFFIFLFLILLFELLVFLVCFSVFLFRLHFLFLIFLYLIEWCNFVFY